MPIKIGKVFIWFLVFGLYMLFGGQNQNSPKQTIIDNYYDINEQTQFVTKIPIISKNVGVLSSFKKISSRKLTIKKVYTDNDYSGFSSALHQQINGYTKSVTSRNNSNQPSDFHINDLGAYIGGGIISHTNNNISHTNNNISFNFPTFEALHVSTKDSLFATQTTSRKLPSQQYGFMAFSSDLTSMNLVAEEEFNLQKASYFEPPGDVPVGDGFWFLLVLALGYAWQKRTLLKNKKSIAGF